MAHGKTLDLLAFTRTMRWRTITKPVVARDRSLNGKARITARKAQNKERNA